jgi:hypothetical protein
MRAGAIYEGSIPASIVCGIVVRLQEVFCASFLPCGLSQTLGKRSKPFAESTGQKIDPVKDFPLLPNDVVYVARAGTRAVLGPVGTTLVGSLPYLLISLAVAGRF